VDMLKGENKDPEYLSKNPMGAGRDANVFVEGLRFEPEPLTLDRLDVLRTPN
jgi:hypothetical protein